MRWPWSLPSLVRSPVPAGRVQKQLASWQGGDGFSFRVEGIVENENLVEVFVVLVRAGVSCEVVLLPTLEPAGRDRPNDKFTARLSGKKYVEPLHLSGLKL